MTSPRVLILGGHGKVSLLLTPHLLRKSWAVTSVIRDASQTDEILALNKPADATGKVEVLVESLEDLTSLEEAKKLLDKTRPDYVVWSAGAGGKGGPSRTHAIDSIAARNVVSAAVATESVTKFLLVSYLGSRRNKPSWWSDEEWKKTTEVNEGALKNYYKAKLEADEHLVREAKKRASFKAIDLRPGTLSDDAPTGKVAFGRTKLARGKVTRADVAHAAALLLDEEGAEGWYDLLEGDEDIAAAVKRAVKEKDSALDGEDL